LSSCAIGGFSRRAQLHDVTFVRKRELGIASLTQNTKQNRWEIEAASSKKE
jgi:hypothetical protein